MQHAFQRSEVDSAGQALPKGVGAGVFLTAADHVCGQHDRRSAAEAFAAHLHFMEGAPLPGLETSMNAHLVPVRLPQAFGAEPVPGLSVFGQQVFLEGTLLPQVLQDGDRQPQILGFKASDRARMCNVGCADQFVVPLASSFLEGCDHRSP